MIFGGASMVAIGLVGAGAVSPRVLLVPAAAATALATYLGVGVTVLEGWRAAVDLFVGAPQYLAWKAASTCATRDPSHLQRGAHHR